MKEELTQVEKAWLIILFDEGYRWLARDEDYKLFACTLKPKYEKGKLILDNHNNVKQLNLNLFPLMEDYIFYKICCNAPADCFYLEEKL